MEISELNRPKTTTITTNILDGIARGIKFSQDEKKRSDIEAKLYKRWRYGMSPDREKIILDSKSSHEALAKLNWMDKQVAMHLTKQQEDKETEERQLRLLEEQRKHEEYIEKCRILRDSEIKELRTMQENHIHELQLRETESSCFRAEESHLRKRKDEIENEYQRFIENSLRRKEHAVMLYNIRRIKMLFRKRSEEIIRSITDDIAMLKRIIQGLKQSDTTNYVFNVFDSQLKLEQDKFKCLDAMYESEAKNELLKAETKWETDRSDREHLLKSVMADQVIEIDRQLDMCIDKQKSLLDVKETHLQAIESANGRLKNLVSDSDRDLLTVSMDNLSVSKSQETCTDVNSESNSEKSAKLEPPRYGRKKMAWT